MHVDISQSRLQAIISASQVNSASGTSDASATSPASPSAASQLVHIRSTTILEHCRRLLERHDTSTRHIDDAGSSLAIGQTWRQDRQEVKHQIEVGGKLAKIQVGKHLDYADNDEESNKNDKAELLDNSGDVDLIFDICRKVDGEERKPSVGGTWAVTAHGIKKDVQRLIRKHLMEG